MRTPSLIIVVFAALVGSGCGSDDERSTTPRSGSSSASPQATPAGSAVAIEEFKFVPEDVTVDAGTTVTWTNEDVAPHTATADDGSFDTGNLRKGATGKVTFRKAGSFTYFCEFHRFMRARITVR